MFPRTGTLQKNTQKP